MDVFGLEFRGFHYMQRYSLNLYHRMGHGIETVHTLKLMHRFDFTTRKHHFAINGASFSITVHRYSKTVHNYSKTVHRFAITSHL